MFRRATSVGRILFRTAASALVLACIVSCTDATGPLAKSVPAAHRSLAASSAAYVVSAVPFEPEASPATLLMTVDDSVAYDTPIGFDFSFYGNTYRVLHVSSNGLVGFDRTIGVGAGGVIPSADDGYNNLIAVAWTDLNSSVSGADIRYETRGTAPNRKFILQYNNVPEFFSGPGHVTAQLVLSEGSNDITLYTTSLDISGSNHEVTQGIENASGTDAAFVPGRVQAFFTLSNDAVRFSPAPTIATVQDDTPPSIVVPANLSVDAVSPNGAPVSYSVIATDNVSVTSVSCTIPSGGVFPIGVTNTTCTASDAAGNRTSGWFTVTVLGAKEQIVALYYYVYAASVPNGTKNQLLSQLEAAYNALTSQDVPTSCVKLDSFASILLKKNSNVSPPQADRMLSDSGRIRRVLAC
jgi:hypothetical protein